MPSLVWVVPIIAALVGLSLLINTWRAAGPRITISFQTAEGLEVGKTLVKYRDVTIGHVTAITLSADQKSVIVTADLAKSGLIAASYDTQFWVVRPRFGVGWVSGLDTLLSGAFISAEPGESKVPRREFVGLEDPPPLLHAREGKPITLHARDLGSVSLGAPVYFRHLQVGRIIDEKLNADGSGVQLMLFINAPYDRFVSESTRFWNVSGVEVSLGANGMNVKTQSLMAVLAGGIAFGTAPPLPTGLSMPASAHLLLYKDEAAAMAPPDGDPHYVRMRFDQSLRGLAVGAPVEFVGVNIGSVHSIDLDYDVKNRRFPVIVTAQIYPRRMGKAYDALVEEGAAENEEKMAQLVGELVARGLRAQPRAGSLLTPQLYLALDFIPGAGKVHYNAAARPLEIPTIPGSIDELQLKLANIVNKIDALPLGDLARHLDSDLVGLHDTFGRVNGEVLPNATDTLAALRGTLGNVDRLLSDDAPWRDSVDQTLGEARRTLNSIRSLADYLDRHPQALLLGRPAEKPNTEVPPTTSDAPP
ncbi:MAG TPA: MlaD family protein [Steroidobacteraceae bacterium]|nr:MlaD family protein [Steroidobacteraceae bacterium]